MCAAWRHRGARIGFEVVFFAEDQRRIEGESLGVEDGEVWRVDYDVRLDADGRTRCARVSGRSASGTAVVALEADGEGGWLVDGSSEPELDGCLDVDLEASAFTNALPVRRLGLAVGEAAEAPAAWVRMVDLGLGLGIERLEQRYERLDDEGDRLRFAYAAPELDFRATLVHDAAGLGLEYPGLAVRER